MKTQCLLKSLYLSVYRVDWRLVPREHTTCTKNATLTASKTLLLLYSSRCYIPGWDLASSKNVFCWFFSSPEVFPVLLQSSFTQFSVCHFHRGMPVLNLTIVLCFNYQVHNSFLCFQLMEILNLFKICS